MSLNEINNDRRSFLTKATLSGAAVALLAGQSKLAVAASSSSKDVDILNVALGLEHEGIAAYQVGAESGLLSKAVLGVAVGFQSDHKAHRDLLVKTINSLGGTPVQAKGQYNFDLSGVKGEADVLKFALGLELGAARAYLSVVPSFKNTDLAQAAADLCASETMHVVLLREALGMNPVPAAFFSKIS